ncbi:MAG: LamG-like jellyroll fold domain-containing protein [Thermodesulfobacteriota bacterium]|nr:LamG-like jellyroll fold domain-containing protein [Thermodesulfobacteriota bacterium]
MAAAGAAGAWNPGLLTDPNCVALYNFASGALTTDSKGTNDLTNVNGVNECTAIKGIGCADFEKDNNQYFSRADTLLSDDFPLKSGTENNKISVCSWVKPESMSADGVVFSKFRWSNQTKSFAITIKTNGFVELKIGYDTLAEVVCTFGTALTVGKLYHVGVTYDGDTKEGRIRIFDNAAGDQLGVDAINTGAQVINIRDASVMIGAWDLGLSTIDAQLAEMPIFNDILTPDEIDKIRQGTF